MKNQDQGEAGKDLAAATVESPRPAPHKFQSMHEADSCWHCDERMRDPIHAQGDAARLTEKQEVEEVHGFDYDIGGKFYDWDY